MVDLANGFSEGTILSLVFILVASDMFVNGVSASESFWIYAPGLITAIPMAVIKVVSGSFPLLAPLGALAMLWWFVYLKETLGSGIYWTIFAGALVMFLGV
ncbi:MAG: hypothetical protein Q8P02_01590 [Candidatus Micrarchaeota archaeon]|nr:hypothetical protein [Candidatus Micrarchaeota archaeon]